jgi:hypothetical protein
VRHPYVYRTNALYDNSDLLKFVDNNYDIDIHPTGFLLAEGLPDYFDGDEWWVSGTNKDNTELISDCFVKVADVMRNEQVQHYYYSVSATLYEYVGGTSYDSASWVFYLYLNLPEWWSQRR